MSEDPSIVGSEQPEDPAGRRRTPRARSGGPRQVAAPAAPVLRPWAALARALASALATLEDEQRLTLRPRQTAAFVRATARRAGGLRIEAASNNSLAEPEWLDRRGIRRMKQLGWLLPTHPPGKGVLTDRQRKGSTEFFLDLGEDVDCAAVAEMLIATLREVYGIPSPGRLVYTASDDRGREILLPTLGLDRVPASAEPAGQAKLLRPQNATQLEDAVLATLKDSMDISDMAFDARHEISLCRGKVSVLLRVATDAPSLDIYATVARKAQPGLELLEALNEHNNELRFIQLTLAGPSVVACVSVDATVFHPGLLTRALTALADAVDATRAEFRARFAGKLDFGDDPAPAPQPSQTTVN